MKLFAVLLIATFMLWGLITLATWDSAMGTIVAFVLGGLFWEGVHRLEKRT